MLKGVTTAIALSILGTSAAFADQDVCTSENRCIQDQALRVELEKVRIRGNVANISIRLTNQTGNDLELSIFREYLSATTYGGERVRLSTNRDIAMIVADGTRSLAYSLEFNDPVGEGFDLVLTFESPDSSYAFFDVENYP